MAVVAVVVFMLLRLAPGDPIAILAGDNATPDQVEAIRHSLGLEDSLPVQFLRWISAVLHGDLGTSIFTGAPVLSLIGERLEPTLSLAAITFLWTVPLAVAAGVVAAAKAGSLHDRSLMLVSVL